MEPISPPSSNTTEPTIRLWKPEEVEQRRDELLGTLLAALISSPISAVADGHLRAAAVELIRAVDYAERYFVMVGHDPRGEVVGFALAKRESPKARLPGELESEWPGWASGATVLIWLAVTPGWRRRGIAGHLHDAVLDHLDTARAYLYTDTRNVPAVTLYRRRGWFELGTRRKSLLLGRARCHSLGAHCGDGDRG